MIRKLTLLTGAAVGYVLGTRAGRERYDQIVRLVQRARERPEVQDATDRVTEAVKETLSGDGPVADAKGKAKATVQPDADADAGDGSAGVAPSSPVEGVPEEGTPEAQRSSVVVDPPPPSSTAGDTAKPA